MNNFRDRLAEPLVWLIAVGTLIFPFSVAGANTVFALAIFAASVSGHFATGVTLLRERFPMLLAAISVYLLLIALGITWSQDWAFGLKVLSHQWLWLLLPVFAAVCVNVLHRNRILIALSAGLALHLGYCLLQGFGVVYLTFAGSGTEDPTGYIGHIGFGFVYAVWGGWLLHRGWLERGYIRWGAWLLSAWAFVMVFMAQGRSGYLICLAILLLVIYKHAASGLGLKKSLLGIALILVAVTTLAAGPGKERVISTWESISAAMHGDLAHAEARWKIWYAAIEVYRSQPLLGVGTGGFPVAYKKVTDASPKLLVAPEGFSHPHNVYLQSLVRWGISGLVVLLFLLGVWIRSGGRIDWMTSPENSLILISGVAVAVHGLTAASLEEHFPAMMAIMMLGTGCGSAFSRR